MRTPTHPAPVTGAALYWAEGDEVLMKCTEGYTSVIDKARTAEAAAKKAERWQRKENSAVEKEAKRVAKLARV